MTQTKSPKIQRGCKYIGLAASIFFRLISVIALVAGTQVDDGGDPPTYTSVATITADATETWEEHGMVSTTTDSLFDRNLTSGQSVNSSDTQYTLVETVNPEV